MTITACLTALAAVTPGMVTSAAAEDAPAQTSPTTAGPAADDHTKTVFSDDFQSGFSTSPSGRWETDFGGVDGRTTTSESGLHVDPTGVDPVTGKPAFAVTAPQSSGDQFGFADHTKYMATPRVTTEEGLPGFDVPADGSLTCTTRLAATTTGTGANPFGKNVRDAESDLRLAAGSANTFDPANNMVFDFFITNTEIFAYYERLRLPGTTYASFSYAVPVAKRKPGEQNTYQIVIDHKQSRATWKVDGKNVLSVNRIGTRALPKKYQLLDMGGTDEVVKVDQLDCGIATFTLLDGKGPGGKGLVREDSDPGYYTSPTSFVDDEDKPANRLFGQGADLDVGDFTVTTS